MVSETEVKQLIAEINGMPEDCIKKDDNFVDDLAMDSLDMVELFCAIEDKFDITLKESEFDNTKTVEDLITLLQKGETDEAYEREEKDTQFYRRFDMQ